VVTACACVTRLATYVELMSFSGHNQLQIVSQWIQLWELKYATSTCDKNKIQMPGLSRIRKRCIPSLLHHIGEVHSFEPNFHIVCGLTLDSIRETCPATYTNYGLFWSHLYTKHRRLINLHLLLDSSECNKFKGPHDLEENCHKLRNNHIQDAEEVHTASVDCDSHSS